MTQIEHDPEERVFLRRMVEATIRIGVLAVLVFWSFDIVRPFIIPIIWGLIIAVAIYTPYCWLTAKLGGRGGLASAVVALLLLAVLVVPAFVLSGTLVDGSQALSQSLDSGTLNIPPPPTGVSEWPLVGEPLYKIWSLASVNLEAAIKQLAPQLKAIGGWLLSAGVGVGLGLLQFVIAIVIAAVMLAHAESGGNTARAIATRLAGERGVAFAGVAETTVRGVARGILGVAIIQSLLAGLGFMVMGIPAAGLWALLCLVLAVIQIGPTLVILPIIFYVFSTADPVAATLFAIWGIAVALLDNVLKPILLGRGAKVPMLVIFIGAIGGFMSTGIIGLFVGAVILALAYELFQMWLYEVPVPGEDQA